MDWDEGEVQFHDQGLRVSGEGEAPSAARVKYREFIRNFRDPETDAAIYRCE